MPLDDGASDVFIDIDLLTEHIVNSLQVPRETVVAVPDAENSFLFEKSVLGVKLLDRRLTEPLGCPNP